MKIDQKKLEKSQLEITFELSEEEFKHYIEHALEHFKKHVKVDGFRPGQAPNKLVEDKIKPESLLMEAGDIAVRETYSKYILESKLEPVGQPEVSITKIAKGSPFLFKAKITVLPDVELPDYKKIAKTIKGKEISVTEEEIQDSINYLQKTRAKFTAHNNPAEKSDFVEIKYQNKDINEGKEVVDKFILGEGGFMKGFEDGIIGMKSGEEKEVTVVFPADAPRKDLAGKEAIFKVRVVSVQKMELPELNDEFAKELGAFDSFVTLKESMKEGISAEKTEAEKQRIRGEILEKIAEKAKFSAGGGSAPGGELPESMVEYEKERLIEGLKNKITQSIKITFEEYLASIKKTEEEIKETYQKEAEKRLRGFLVLRELGQRENIQVSDEEVEEEVSKSIRNYSKESRPDQSRGRGSSIKSGQLSKIDSSSFAKGERVDINELKEYTKGVIQNEKIFQILENFGTKS